MATTAVRDFRGSSSDLIECSHGLVVCLLNFAHVLNMSSGELFVHVQEVEEIVFSHRSVCVASSVAEEAESKSLLLGLVGWVIWLEVLASMVAEGSPPVVDSSADD